MTQNISDNYYITTVDKKPQWPAVRGKHEVDVCVVGGGLAGMNTALSLLERGKTVAVVEGAYIGYGASGRNAGFVAKGYAAGETELAGKLGIEHAQRLVTLTKNARKIIHRRVADHAIDCGPMTPGVLIVSWKDDAQGTRDYVAKGNDNFDLGYEFWPRDKVRAHCKTDKYYDGVFSPHDFQMNPLKYLFGLASAVSAKGGMIFENSRVTQVVREGAGWRVETAEGSVSARDVVMCCAVYSQGLDKRLENAVIPVRTYIMVTAPMDDDVYAQSVNTPHAIYDSRFCSDYYRRLPDNRLLWGGRVSLFAHPSDIASTMLGDLLKIYPQLQGRVTPEFAWSGLLAYAPHKMPQIGMIEKGYWYNTGFGGHGLCPTTAGGEAVAAAIAEGDNLYRQFDPFGLSYAGGKWGRFGAQAVYLWWRLRDMAGL